MHNTVINESFIIDNIFFINIFKKYFLVLFFHNIFVWKDKVDNSFKTRINNFPFELSVTWGFLLPAKQSQTQWLH